MIAGAVSLSVTPPGSSATRRKTVGDRHNRMLSNSFSQQTVCGEIDWAVRLRRLAWWSGWGGGATEKVLHRMKGWLALASEFGGFARFEAVKRARDVGELLTTLEALAPDVGSLGGRLRT